jgi:hypothetical protein
LAVEWLMRVPSADHLSPWFGVCLSSCYYSLQALMRYLTKNCDCEYVTTRRTHLFLLTLSFLPPLPLGPIVNIICNVTNFKSIYEMKLWEH